MDEEEIPKIGNHEVKVAAKKKLWNNAESIMSKIWFNISY